MNDLLSLIKEKDNFFPFLLQKQIMNHYFGPNAPWSYSPSVSYDKLNHRKIISSWHKEWDTIQDSDGFFYPIRDDIGYNKILKKNLAYHIKEKFDIDVNEFIRLQFLWAAPDPLYKENGHGYPHIDSTEKHYVLLYYLTDNDAETIFFDQYYDKEKEFNYSKYEIIHRIKPKQNKAVLFDGYVFHATSISRLSRRIILNVVFK